MPTRDAPYLRKKSASSSPVDYQLLYSQRSLNDHDDIIGHIAGDDADAASRFPRLA